jgi:NAD(P)H dehydrogenase (quinone)
MKVLIVHAHPADDSFVAHMRDVVAATLRAGGHELDVADLYREGFDPLPSGERGPSPGGDERALADQWSRLSRAQGLVFVHPTWWGGQPAILKGWFDRVLANAAVTGGEGHNRRRALHHVRRLAAVTTHGSPRWVNRLQGEPGRCTSMRALRAAVHPRARCQWLACYGLDRSGDGERARFADRVAQALARW